jgi:hypothetical protein
MASDLKNQALQLARAGYASMRATGAPCLPEIVDSAISAIDAALAQPEAPAEPSGWQLNAVTHVAAWLGDLQDVPRDASYWTNGRFAADCMDAHDVLLAAPVAQQPAELSIVAGRPNRDAFEVAVSQVLVRWDSELTYTVAQAVSDLMSFLYLDRKAPLGSRAIKAQGGRQ